jgi:hypothetical protein
VFDPDDVAGLVASTMKPNGAAPQTCRPAPYAGPAQAGASILTRSILTRSILTRSILTRIPAAFGTAL